MYYYETGYSDYEACPTDTLYHDKLFTKEEFDEMVVNCYVKESKIQEDKHNELLRQYPQDDGDSYRYDYNPSISSLYCNVVEHLMNDYGFRKPKISADFVASDTEDIIPRVDGGREFRDTYCDKLKLLRERFNIIEPRDNKIKNILDGK